VESTANFDGVRTALVTAAVPTGFVACGEKHLLSTT